MSGPRIFHIHLGDKGGAENFFLRLVAAFAEAGLTQKALVRPDRVWADELSRSCAVETGTFSASKIKRYLGRRRVAAMAQDFQADLTMAWMAPAGRWIPVGRNAAPGLIRLGDFPTAMAPLERARHIIGNTPEIRRQCIAMGWPEARAHMISNFVETPAPASAAKTKRKTFHLVALGRFVDIKGFADLLEAVRLLPDVSLTLLGDGELRPAFGDFVRQHDLQNRVFMPGWIADATPYLQDADALVCPSLVEPLGNVVLEGWAARLPVVATDSEGPGWLIEHGVDGLLVPKADGAALAAAIARLRDENIGPALVAAATAKMEARFSREAIVSQYLDLFEIVASGR